MTRVMELLAMTVNTLCLLMEQENTQEYVRNAIIGILEINSGAYHVVVVSIIRHCGYVGRRRIMFLIEISYITSYTLIKAAKIQ